MVQKAGNKAIYVEQVVFLEGRSWSTQTDRPDHNSTLQLLGSAQLVHMAPIHPL